MDPSLPTSTAFWHIHAEGRVWGPYALDRLTGFIVEGRLSQKTLISSGAEGPFAPAGEVEGLASLFPGAAPTDLRIGVVAPAATYGRPLLVFAALGGSPPAAFESLLTGFGPVERAGPQLWLLRVDMGAAALRNALSRHLQASDSLMVVEAELETAAWFNLNAAEERRLRALWTT